MKAVRGGMQLYNMKGKVPVVWCVSVVGEFENDVYVNY